MNRRHTLGLLLFVAFLAACGSSQPVEPTPSPIATETPRAFALGMSSLPAELTEDAYANAFQLPAEAGELILIQRTPPWEELLDGSFPSNVTVETTQLEIELAETYDLQLFVAIDPTDAAAGRRQLTELPTELSGAGFADERIREALTEYALYVTANYRPTYLAIGVEINTYERDKPEDFEAFLTLYAEIYDAVKELEPDTLVFPTLQLEELHGLLPLDDPRPVQWNLIERFEPRLDLLAVSSYPGIAFEDPELIPSDYFSTIALHTDRPIAIASMGYPSQPAEDELAGRTENQQSRVLRRALDEADALSMTFVVWFVGQDPAFTGEGPLSQLQYAGLLRQDGETKPAWLVWRDAARHPLLDPSGG